MALRGHLHDVALPDILQLLAAQGKSGVLTLCHGREEVRILLAEGKAVSAESNVRSLYQRVGTLLVKSGRLARADLERVLEIQRASGRKLGELLVRETTVSTADVRRALALQVLQIVHAVLRWDDASYDFERREVDYDREYLEPVSIQAILMDGMRMIDEWPAIEKRLGNRQTVLQKAQEEAEPLGGGVPDEEPSPIEAEVLAAIDGRLTIQQIIDRSMQLEFDVCKAVYDLMERGRVAAAFEGRLEEAGLADLFLAVRRARSSGALEIRQGARLRTLQFQDGDLAACASSDPDDGLAPFLLRRGLFSRREAEEAMATDARAEGIGEYLVRSGRLSREQLPRILAEHMGEIAASSFGWNEGTYNYRPGQGVAAPSAELMARTPVVVLQGIRSIQRWSKLRGAVGSSEQRWRHVEESWSPAWDELPAEHMRFLQAFGAGLPVEAACRSIEAPEHLALELIWWGSALGLLAASEVPVGVRVLCSALAGGTEPAPEDEIVIPAAPSDAAASHVLDMNREIFDPGAVPAAADEYAPVDDFSALDLAPDLLAPDFPEPPVAAPPPIQRVPAAKPAGARR